MTAGGALTSPPERARQPGSLSPRSPACLTFAASRSPIASVSLARSTARAIFSALASLISLLVLVASVLALVVADQSPRAPESTALSVDLLAHLAVLVTDQGVGVHAAAEVDVLV